MNTKTTNSILANAFSKRWFNYEGDAPLEEVPFDVEMLDGIVKDLKFSKAAGMDNLSAEHIKYCHPIVTSTLT